MFIWTVSKLGVCCFVLVYHDLHWSINKQRDRHFAPAISYSHMVLTHVRMSHWSQRDGCKWVKATCEQKLAGSGLCCMIEYWNFLKEIALLHGLVRSLEKEEMGEYCNKYWQHMGWLYTVSLSSPFYSQSSTFMLFISPGQEVKSRGGPELIQQTATLPFVDLFVNKHYLTSAFHSMASWPITAEQFYFENDSPCSESRLIH